MRPGWRREGKGREGGMGVGGGGWLGGVRVEISEEEMRIQKGGHHSDSHLFSFSPSHMQARAHTRATSASGRLNISVATRKAFVLRD